MGRLSSFGRLILFDKRGTGLSDRIGAMPTLEERMDDVRAVMDAVACKQAGLVGYSEGGPLSILFAATYPQRTSALVLYGSYARRMWAPDCPWGRTEEQLDEFLKLIAGKWGQGDSLAKDLVAGAGIRFEQRGSHILKGAPGEWTLLAAS